MTTKHIHKQLKQQILTIIILYTFSLSIHSENTKIYNTHNNLNNSISYTSKQKNKTNTTHRTYNHYNNTNNINSQNITNNTTIQIKPASLDKEIDFHNGYWDIRYKMLELMEINDHKLLKDLKIQNIKNIIYCTIHH